MSCKVNIKNKITTSLKKVLGQIVHWKRENRSVKGARNTIRYDLHGKRTETD